MMLSEQELNSLIETVFEGVFVDVKEAFDAALEGKTVLSYYKGKLAVIRNVNGNLRNSNDGSSIDLNRIAKGNFLVLGGN